MSSSVPQICNSALIKLGASTILALTETSKEASLCNLRYADCRDYVLREHDWNCARKRVILASEVTVPAFDYTYQFQLPSDYVRFVSSDVAKDQYEIEGRKILADATSVELIYIWQVDDPTIFDIHVSEAISYRLAYDISYALTQSAGRQKQALDDYIMFLKRAKWIDAQEGPRRELKAEHFVDSRISGVQT